MKHSYGFPVKAALVVLLWLVWWQSAVLSLSPALNLVVIFGGVLLIYPFVWLCRKILDRNPTASRAVLVTTFVHLGMGFFIGVPIVRATVTYPDWRGWVIPIPTQVGLALVILSGVAFTLVVVNLALKGSGAPFFIALSEKLATGWMYAWSRNPMMLAAMALLASLGLWFQSALFLVWGFIFLSPAVLFFMKFYEERELELRFGASYLEYRSRTPFLWPRKPKG